MQPNIEKITLSLDKTLLMEMAEKSNKTMSEFVRDLVQREKELTDTDLIISPEIASLKGCLNSPKEDTKERVKKAARRKLRNHDII